MPITHDQHLAALVRTGYNIDSCELAGCEGALTSYHKRAGGDAVIFRPELVDKILAGGKTVTRRRLPRRDEPRMRYREGQTYALQPGRGKPHVGHIVIRQVRFECLGNISVFEAQREGFLNVGEFLFYWEQLHGIPKLDEAVAVIDFELAPPCPTCAEWPEP